MLTIIPFPFIINLQECLLLFYFYFNISVYITHECQTYWTGQALLNLFLGHTKVHLKSYFNKLHLQYMYCFSTGWHKSLIILVWYRMTQKFDHTCLVQDDTKVLMAKHDVQMMLETTQKQQQQFSDIPDQLPLDPNIPITFTKVKSCTFMPSCFLKRSTKYCITWLCHHQFLFNF